MADGTPIAEVTTLLGRAASRRLALLDLLDVVPGDYWQRRETGSPWTARNHLDHVATTDIAMVDVVDAALRGANELEPFGTGQVEVALARRQAAIDAVADETLEAATGLLVEARARLVEALSGLRPEHLEAQVILAGAVDAWGHQQTMELRQYLAAWTGHDSEHAEGIRRAIANPPGPGDLALRARFR